MPAASDRPTMKAARTYRYSCAEFFIVFVCDGGSISGSIEVFGTDNGERAGIKMRAQR